MAKPRQRGYITARGKGYRITVRLGRDPQDAKKYLRYNEQFNGTSREAQVRLTEILREIDTGSFIVPSKTPLSGYLQSWLAGYCKTNLAERTGQLYNYLCYKHIVPEIGNIGLTELKPQHLQNLYALKKDRGLSPRTVQLIHVCIHKALKYAVKTGLLMRNAADIVDKPPSSRREFTPMTESDLHIFLEYARQTDYYALFYTALFTGMRRAELLGLKWADVDLIMMQVSVKRSIQHLGKRTTFIEPKTAKSRRSISLTPSNAEVLQEYRDQQNKLRAKIDMLPLSDNDLVFCHYDGSPLLPDSITHLWAKLVKRCGLAGIRLHDARHTHATILLKQGVHPKIVQERLGHSNIGITLDTYSHVVPGLQEAAAKGFDTILTPKREIEKL